METPMVCVHWCIPEARGAVPLPLELFTINATNENIDEARGAVPFPWNYSLCKTPMETSTICVR
jgi:hypothetical protein